MTRIHHPLLPFWDFEVQSGFPLDPKQNIGCSPSVLKLFLTGEYLHALVIQVTIAHRRSKSCLWDLKGVYCLVRAWAHQSPYLFAFPYDTSLTCSPSTITPGAFRRWRRTSAVDKELRRHVFCIMSSPPPQNSAKNSSFSGLYMTLGPTALIAVVYILIFLILRRSNRRWYAPRTYLGTLREE